MILMATCWRKLGQKDFKDSLNKWGKLVPCICSFLLHFLMQNHPRNMLEEEEFKYRCPSANQQQEVSEELENLDSDADLQSERSSVWGASSVNADQESERSEEWGAADMNANHEQEAEQAEQPEDHPIGLGGGQRLADHVEDVVEEDPTTDNDNLDNDNSSQQSCSSGFPDLESIDECYQDLGGNIDPWGSEEVTSPGIGG
ncbi:hypothetical protein BSKO_10774 [Bryopsis sp. KO-2023]|nr:hypothetical protein BSKO_10774 [Bryopsis sp. KO-2023]